MAEADDDLPTTGEMLLAFKRQHHSTAGWGREHGGVSLDDPATRLAELDEFFDGAAVAPDEEQAMQAAMQASQFLQAAVTPEPELAPWLDAMVTILHEAHPVEEPGR